MGGGKNRQLTDRTALIGLLGVIAGAVVVTIYYFVNVWYCNRRREGGPSSGREGPETSQEDMPTSTSYSMAQLLPIFRYAKESEGDTCAVCLCEFKKSEEVRVLPECLHLFHVSCIDAWLNGHSNCPLCRADTLPPLNLVFSLPNPGGIPLTGSPQPTRL